MTTLHCQRSTVERIARVAPGLHAAVERDRARVAHLAQRRGGERRDPAELAVRSGCARVGSGSSLSTRSSSWPRGRCRAPGMWPASKASFSRTSRTTRSSSPRSTRARAPRPCDMNGDLARRLGEQLRDRLAAAHVGAQRLGQVVGHLEVEARCIIATKSARSLFCRRGLLGYLGADRRLSCGPCSRAPG